MDTLFPIIKKYGAYAICLCLDEDGIPHTGEKRIAIAEKLIENAKRHGIPEERLIIDTLVLTASAQQEEVMETLNAIKILKSKYRVKTTLGVSNVSYGLPFRSLINRVFFTLALGAGLDTAIINPGAEGIMDTLHAFRVLNNDDRGAVAYIDYNAKKEEAGSRPAAVKNPAQAIPSAKAIPEGLTKMLLEGADDQAKDLIGTRLESTPPLEVVDMELIPALDDIGAMYERKEIFLPQMIRAAETVKGAFDLVKDKLEEGTESMEPRGSLALATVRGDIHDIGKNLVKIMLESYGYRVVDLGKDVEEEAILETLRKEDIGMVGLSALMTTTVSNMEETILQIRKEFPQVKIMVGGAVLTEDYATKIGADFFCRDARAAVVVANQVFS
jgi:5-methyltetrahydrofolate--homocysteine methyltransferase